MPTEVGIQVTEPRWWVGEQGTPGKNLDPHPCSDVSWIPASAGMTVGKWRNAGREGFAIEFDQKPF